MDIKTLTLAVVTAVFSLSACGSTAKEAAAVGITDVADMGTNGNVTKTLNLKHFKEINSSLNVVISYTQGNDYKVTVSGGAGTIAATDISVSNGTLKIAPKKNNANIDNGKSGTELRLDITAPAIENIENYGRMSFTTGTVSTGKMSVNNSGVLSFNAISITGNQRQSCFKIENHGRADVKTERTDIGTTNVNNSGVLDFDCGKAATSTTEIENHGRMNISGTVKSSSVNINNSGACTSDASYNVSGSYDFTNHGRYKNDRDITAKSITINNSGTDTEGCTLKADVLDITIYGRCKYDINFSGDTAKLNCSGVGDFNLNVDCKDINVEASGNVKVKLSGTADNTEFNGSGISKIDTSGLNKF